MTVQVLSTNTLQQNRQLKKKYGKKKKAFLSISENFISIEGVATSAFPSLKVTPTFT